MGSGPARCKKCSRGFRLTGAKCLGKWNSGPRMSANMLCPLICLYFSDIDECSEKALACPGLNEACVNEEGSFRCECAEGYIRRDSICVENLPPSK